MSILSYSEILHRSHLGLKKQLTVSFPSIPIYFQPTKYDIEWNGDNITAVCGPHLLG